MLSLLIDEGLPAQVAAALRELDLDVLAIGDPGAPPKKSGDDVNVAWCARRGAALVTNDRGRKERVIIPLLAQHRVHAIFIYKELRAAPPHHLALALLSAGAKMDQVAAKGLLHHKLRTSGGLEKR